jgi:hypothetical protein
VPCLNGCSVIWLMLAALRRTGGARRLHGTGTRARPPLVADGYDPALADRAVRMADRAECKRRQYLPARKISIGISAGPSAADHEPVARAALVPARCKAGIRMRGAGRPWRGIWYREIM